MKDILLNVLPSLAPAVDYSTAQIAARISSSADQNKLCRDLLNMARRHPQLVDLGPERPGKGLSKGKMVRPKLWHYMPRAAVEAALASGDDRNSRITRLEEAVADLRRRVETLEEDQ